MTESEITHHPRWQCTWSAEDIAQLYRGSHLGQTATEIGAALGRTAKSIREKCSSLGVVMRSRPQSHWPNERLEHCKRLYEEGKSATETARELHLTRNAVIGKWHRHPDLFPPRPHIVNGHSAIKKMRARRPLGLRVYQKPQRQASPVAHPNHEITELPHDISPFSVSIADLRPGHCRWPVTGGSEFMYCGGGKVEDHSYCARHCRIAFRPFKRMPRPFIQKRRWGTG